MRVDARFRLSGRARSDKFGVLEGGGKCHAGSGLLGVRYWGIGRRVGASRFWVWVLGLRLKGTMAERWGMGDDGVRMMMMMMMMLTMNHDAEHVDKRSQEKWN